LTSDILLVHEDIDKRFAEILGLIKIPFCVVIDWIMGQKMKLYFQVFEITTLFITVLVVAFMLQVGS
jgi:Ca2+/H+ antiporter